MIAIEHDFKGVNTYSLPKIAQDATDSTEAKRYHIELGVKANGEACTLLDAAWDRLKSEVRDLGGEVV